DSQPPRAIIRCPSACARIDPAPAMVPCAGRTAVSACGSTATLRRNMPSTAMPLSIVILAAGQGKRMKSALAKVRQPLARPPLLQHVIQTARSLSPADIHVVYGHGGQAVPAALSAERVTWVQQLQQLGTGHA